MFEKNFTEKKHVYIKVAYSILYDEEDAKDVLQEAYCEALKHIKDLRDYNSFDIWFYKILINKCKQMYKKAKYRTKQLPIDESTPPTDAMFSKTRIDEKIILKDIIFNLSNEHREIIILKYFQGFSLKEISEITDLSIFFTLEDTKNINNGCQFGNILITVDNEPCSYQGNYGQNYTENISFGDFNISLKDDKVPNEVQLKIYDIYVEENAFNKLLVDNGEQASKGKTRVIEGEWIIPIKLDEALIENANKHFAKYKLDYVFNCNDFSVKFTELTVEASKSEIFHELKINNESSKEVVGFSNVEIYSKEGKSISKMTYKNGRYIYKDQNNEIKEVTYRHSFPSSTIMLPFENVNPGKIKILSYTTYEKLGSIDLDLKNLKGKLEQHTDLGDLSVKVDKVSKHRYLLDISFKSRKITPIDMKLISEEQVLDYKDYSIGGREYSEGNIEGNFASVNQSYEINSLSNKYKLEIWGYRDNKIDIEIPIN